MVSLISKGAGLRPDNLRPITVTSVVYRLWAARRLQDLLQWQAAWSPNCQHSYKRQHSTEG
eukprot:12422405-Karenia_brevis.AAC.1